MTYKEYKQLFDQVSKEGLLKAVAAPGKRGWSSMTRQSIPSSNDIIRETNNKLSMIATQCAQAHQNSPSLLTEEKDEKLIG
jgi:hypothetical protein|tara:strand:+ start:114 stop:356 length:243 start_codon:yes stop_codon:yes gene_type:complete